MVLDINELIKELKSKPTISLAFHDDADGIYSAALISSIFKVKNFVCPNEFGDYHLDDDTFVDLGLDLGAPLHEEFEGILIDHHPHPFETKYKLIWDSKPTTGIVYDIFSDMLASEHKWKVVGGLVGDGQVELTPDEIWESYPFLLEQRSTIYRNKYNKLSEYAYPVFKLLSSPVNAMCRVGSPYDAYEIVKRAKTPSDIIDNRAMQSDMDLLDSDERQIWSSDGLPTVQINRYISIVKISSKFKQAGRIAAKLKNMAQNTTWVVINEPQKQISIRGEFAKLISNRLTEHGFKVGGHAGFCGGSLSESQTADMLIEILRSEIKW